MSVGISAAAFSPHATETNVPSFILGTESGGVLVAHLEVLDWTASSSGEAIWLARELML